MQPGVPPYFDYLIDGFQRGEGGRFVHLGHWDEPPPLDRPPEPGEFERAQERLNEILLDMAEIGDTQAVLDVGCGFGGTLEKINEHHRGMRLVGVNIDPRQIDICRHIESRNRNRLGWECADACRLPFPDGSFDRILCIEAMFHFASRRDFFREAARLLRPGGLLIASDIVLSGPAGEGPISGVSIEAALQEGYGPWPDPWGADHGELADGAGLRNLRIVDASSNTLPSYRFTVPTDADERHDPGNPTLRAGITMRWLHREDRLRYLYLKLAKPGNPKSGS